MAPIRQSAFPSFASRAVTRRSVGFAAGLILFNLCATTAMASSGFTTLADFPVPGGHFFSQAGGQGQNAGFSLVDDGAARMYSEYQRLGGLDRLGYPSSQRFSFGGFTTQATQKELLQWRPDVGRASLLNIFDVFSERGLDPELARTKQIPATGDNSADTHLTWPQVVARHLSILDRDPELRARYFQDHDPINDYGLPQAIADYGAVEVIRCERAAFQLWRVATPFARPGDVTQVNAGDLAKDFGVVPPFADVTSTSGGQIVAPPGALITPDLATQASARAVAAGALASLVRIDVTLDDGSGIASGIVIDRDGNILTNEHVVNSARVVKITFANGLSQPARIVAMDASNDLAIVNVPPGSMGAGVTPADLVSGVQLKTGQFLVALGYSPYFPAPPAVRLGVFQSTIGGDISILESDTFILPGDSGGMLLDLSGHVVGVNDEIRVTHQAAQPLIGFSIDAAQALRVGQILLESGPGA